eukprot:jgi/Mesvir1/106/Mv02497-RA.1
MTARSRRSGWTVTREPRLVHRLAAYSTSLEEERLQNEKDEKARDMEMLYDAAAARLDAEALRAADLERATPPGWVAFHNERGDPMIAPIRLHRAVGTLRKRVKKLKTDAIRERPRYEAGRGADDRTQEGPG